MPKIKPIRPSIIATYLEMMGVLAENRSTCGRRKVACMLTDENNQVLSMGYNGPPRGKTHCTDIPCKGLNSSPGTDLDACLAVHAEQNALSFCSDPSKIHNIYTTCSPCMSCVKLFSNTNAMNIYFSTKYANHKDEKEYWVSSKEGRTWTWHVWGPGVC